MNKYSRVIKNSGFINNIGLIMLICGVLIFVFVVIIVSYHDITGQVIGDKNITISVGDKYHEQGFYIRDNGKLVNDELIKVKQVSNVNTKVLGDYHVNYYITYKGKDYKLVRYVKVVDDKEPVLSVNVDKVEKDYCTKESKTNLVYSAIDNYDGDITNNIKVSDEGNKIVISVSDSSGNVTEKSISVSYTDKPETKLELNGYSKIYVPVNTEYSDAGATYTDGCENSNNKLITEGSVDTTTIGNYSLTYYTPTKDTSVSREIIVYNPNVSENNITNDEKILYLTFDDGPGVYTQQVLDTLAKYNVKVTFFVTNQFSNYVPLIEAEHKAGHTVAVHTYTHQWNIYSSVDAYVNDFNAMNDVVEKYTGKRSEIFRFPGGSSNTVSRKYAKGVVAAIASKMTEDGYVYFDWDVDSNDAGGGTEAQIYNNVIYGAEKCSKCVFLMHDIKKNTVNQLDNILNTLTSKGYKFGTLTKDSPTCHLKIAN